MINKQKCLDALESISSSITIDDYKNLKGLCDDGISIAQLFRDEIPTKGSCKITDVEQFLQEEEDQMTEHLGIPYDMESISVPEHIVNENSPSEPEHAKLYARSPADVKFFQEWLEGHHTSLACLYNLPPGPPPDEYYSDLLKAREEAARYRTGKTDEMRIAAAGILRG